MHAQPFDASRAGANVGSRDAAWSASSCSPTSLPGTPIQPYLVSPAGDSVVTERQVARSYMDIRVASSEARWLASPVTDGHPCRA
jgi:hypothetical protein